MNYRRLWTCAGIIAAVILIMFVLSVPRTKDGALESGSLSEPIPEVVFTDSFRRGAHTISGTVTAFDACTAVTALASVDEEASPVRIILSISTQEDPGVCLEVPTKVRFTSNVEAPEGTPIHVLVDGKAIAS